MLSWQILGFDIYSIKHLILVLDLASISWISNARDPHTHDLYMYLYQGIIAHSCFFLLKKMMSSKTLSSPHFKSFNDVNFFTNKTIKKKNRENFSQNKSANEHLLCLKLSTLLLDGTITLLFPWWLPIIFRTCPPHKLALLKEGPKPTPTYYDILEGAC